jgi:DnaJ family protein C protein 25
VLTSNKLRKEYDFFRERPDEYFFKYGSVIYSYKPKTNTLLVILVILMAGSAFTWYAQKNRWQQIANRVVKDAVDDLKAGEGGSAESIELRSRAEEIWKKRKEEMGVDNMEEWKFGDSTIGGKKAKGKKSKKEMKALENEQLRPIIEELVMEMKDFGAGFHQPTWRDILVVRMVRWPVVVMSEVAWQLKYYSRRLAKQELNQEEKEVLTKRAVGPVAWETASAKEREELISMKLWIMENLEEWSELQEIKLLSSKEQKMYGRMKKKQLKNKASKSD